MFNSEFMTLGRLQEQVDLFCKQALDVGLDTKQDSDEPLRNAGCLADNLNK